MVILSKNKSDQNRTSGRKGSGDVYGSSATWLVHTGDSTAATIVSWDGVPTRKGWIAPDTLPKAS